MTEIASLQDPRNCDSVNYPTKWARRDVSASFFYIDAFNSAERSNLDFVFIAKTDIV